MKAVVSNVPVIDGYQTMWRMHGTDRFRKLQKFVADERVERTRTGQHSYMSMSGVPQHPDDDLTVWPDDDVLKVFNELQATQAPRHEHRNTIESVELLMHTTPPPTPLDCWTCPS